MTRDNVMHNMSVTNAADIMQPYFFPQFTRYTYTYIYRRFYIYAEVENSLQFAAGHWYNLHRYK